MSTSVASLLVLACVSVCSAQSSEPPAESKQEPLFTVTLNGSADYAFSTDIDNGGEMSTSRSGVSVYVARRLSDSWRGGVLLSTEASWYDFENATGLIPGTGKPFSQLIETDVSPTAVYTINKTWSIPMGVFFRFAGEKDADVSDSFTWGGFVGARYSVSKDVAISFGIRANDRIEEDWIVLPIAAVDWQIDEATKFEIQPAIGGIGFRLTSKRCDEFSLFLDGVYQSREFRLADDAGLAEGVVRDHRFMIGGGLQWFPCEPVTVTARAGMVAWQEFRIDDRTGVTQVEVESDPTPYVYLGLTMKF